MAIDTLFQPMAGGSASTGSGPYVNEQFLDTSKPATNNTGLTSTASTNPLGYYFNDSDTPTYGIKTLLIDKLSLIEDRSKWISDKPTYEVSFVESFPQVKMYAVGNVRIRNLNQGKCLEIRTIGDLVGITTTGRQVAWIVNATSQSTGSALRYTDAVSTSSISFGGGLVANEQQGENQFATFVHDTSLQTANIHDYRLAANQDNTLRVSGVVVYFENTGANLNVQPGLTYIEKTAVSTAQGATFSLPSISGSLGARSIISKTALSTYALTTVETTNLASVATGNSGTNLLNLTTGHGASFPLGTIVVAASGSSQYFGYVTNQSTDTLTVSPTLAFGLSGAIYKYAYAGPTFAISATMYALKHSIDFSKTWNFANQDGIGVGVSAIQYYQSNYLAPRLWGRNLLTQSWDGYVGLGFNGNTTAFVQVDGDFAAAEIEFASAGIMHGTFAINGVGTWGINSGFSGIFRKTVMADSGPGFNSFVFTPGQSFINTVITKINLYGRKDPVGVTVGQLAAFDSYVNSVDRGLVHNATLMTLGRTKRVYADQLNLTGAWTRGTSYIFAGGVAYYGASTNCALSFQYYGKEFAFVGTQGGVMAATLDGASIAFDFNVLKSVPTMGWHTVALSYSSGATCILHALDFIRPNQMELENKQNYVYDTDVNTIPKVFNQADTPLNAKDGDIWVQRKDDFYLTTQNVWIKLFGLWNKLQFSTVSDDPNIQNFVRSHGTPTGSEAGSVQDVELFNGSSWTSGVASTLGARDDVSSCDNSFGSFHVLLDGLNTSSAVTSTANYFNKYAWSSFTTRTTAKVYSGSAYFSGYFYSNRGSTTAGTANGQTSADKWSGSAWSSGTVWTSAGSRGYYFVQGSLMIAAGYYNTGGSGEATTYQRNLADAVSAGTNIPAASTGISSSGGSGLGVCTSSANGAASTTCYTWNGTSWSSAITSPISLFTDQTNGQANFNNRAFLNGGNASAGGAAVTTSEVFNGSAYATAASSSSARCRGSSSAV